MSTIQLKEQLFKLPSLGIPYEDMGLINGDSLKLRPLLVGDQRDLSPGKDHYSGYMTLLHKVVVEPKNFDFNKLLLVDLNTLVYGIRIMSFGNKWVMPIVCNQCQHFNPECAVDLNDVMCTFADDPDPEALPFGFKYRDLEATANNQKLTFHLLTMGDDKEINTQLRAFRQQNRLKDELTDRGLITLAQSIDTIDGQLQPFNFKFSWLSNLSLPEFNNLTVEITEQLSKSVGVNGRVNATCTQCQAAQVAGLVITPDFFRI